MADSLYPKQLGKALRYARGGHVGGPDHHAFIGALSQAQQSGDPLPFHVYADWLQERDDPLHEVARRHAAHMEQGERVRYYPDDGTPAVFRLGGRDVGVVHGYTRRPDGELDRTPRPAVVVHEHRNPTRDLPSDWVSYAAAMHPRDVRAWAETLPDEPERNTEYHGPRTVLLNWLRAAGYAEE